MTRLFVVFALLAASGLSPAQPQNAAMHNSLSLTAGASGLLRHRFPFDPGAALFTLDAAAGYEPPGLLAQVFIGLRTGRSGLQETRVGLLCHKVFNTDLPFYLGGGIGVHHFTMEPGFWFEPVEDNGISLIASSGIVLVRGRQFRLTGDLKGVAVMTRHFGAPVLAGAAGIGIASEPGGMDIPAPCMLGAVGAFIATGLFLALNR
jgi:hypothetical protein